MRIRTTVAAVTGALALSAFAVPAAQAAPATKTLDVTFSAMKVNGGKAITVGATSKVKVKATYTLTHPANVSVANVRSGPGLYHGSSLEDSDGRAIGQKSGTCTTVSSTTLHCSATVTFLAAKLDNVAAGTWKVGGIAVDFNADAEKWQDGLGSLQVRRTGKLTVDAAPEPVAKGKTITVAGKLSRANWESGKYAGYATQSVKLQFRKKGSSAYTTLKTVKTDSRGNLKTTTKATADGYYRYVFAGTSTTTAVSATGDFVDVR